MTKTVKLFLPNEFHEELLYQYEDKDGELRKLVFEFLKPLAKQGKMVKLNKTIQTRIMKDGKMAMEEKDVREINMGDSAVKENSTWIPEKVTADEIKIYKLSISDRLWDDIVYFGNVFCARLKIYNDSLDPKMADYDEKFAKMPTCLEQIIQDNIVAQLSQSIAGNIDKEYDEEFEEMEKKIAKPPKRNAPKKE